MTEDDPDDEGAVAVGEPCRFDLYVFTERRIARTRRLYNARRRHHRRNWYRFRWDALTPEERAEMCCYILQYPWDPR